ncbi:MAG: hypothetical protein EOP32_26735 [Rhodococcus sp. (in: high G+C Gram-positive bacteria)]|nr:MAG: hypothetical protein EOP32_26735 [Rhodococcus sp. (in: high G+C Gram-positive bacteria)]
MVAGRDPNRSIPPRTGSARQGHWSRPPGLQPARGRLGLRTEFGQPRVAESDFSLSRVQWTVQVHGEGG